MADKNNLTMYELAGVSVHFWSSSGEGKSSIVPNREKAALSRADTNLNSPQLKPVIFFFFLRLYTGYLLYNSVQLSACNKNVCVADKIIHV